jgi:hypothetical protein
METMTPAIQAGDAVVYVGNYGQWPWPWRRESGTEYVITRVSTYASGRVLAHVVEDRPDLDLNPIIAAACGMADSFVASTEALQLVRK